MTDKITQAAPATEGQKKQAFRIIQDALPDTKWINDLIERFCPDKDSAQMLIESGDALFEVRKFLADKVKELSNFTLYADQVVESEFRYLSGYRKARPIDEQIAILRLSEKFFLQFRGPIDWELNEKQKQLLAVPASLGSEGYFAVVFDSIMVTHHENDPAVDQSGPVTRVLQALSKQRDGRLVNHREGKLGPEYYRRSKRSADIMRQLWESQGCPTGIILVPAQLGFTHRGKLVLRARVVIRGSELPLDAYEVLQMVLTHENRLKHYDDLWINLPGSEYSPDANGGFEYALCVWFSDGRVGFGYDGVDDADRGYGSASGFLAQ